MKIRDRIKELRRVKAKDLIPNPKNWRKHPKQQANALRGILAEIGYAGALLARETPVGLQLIDGHLRAETTPDNEVPVLVLDVDEMEANKILATFDPIAAMANADEDALKSLLKSIETENENVKKLLEKVARDEHVSMEDPNAPGAGGDEFDGTPQDMETRVKTGDLWRLGAHRLVCGDSRDHETVTRLMNGERAVLMNTDPPYGVDYAAVKNGIPRSGFVDIQARGGDIENDDLTDGTKLQAFLEEVITSALVGLIENPAFYLWHPMLTQGTFFAAAAAAAADILIHRQIIWVKPGLVLTRSGMYHWKHELCFYGWIRGRQPEWLGDKSQTSVWELSKDQHKSSHPTQKPIELFAIPMRNHTREGDICYEPFSGSGSQFIAAERLKRRCYGIEIAPKYCDVILRRWEAETGKQAEKL